jgi:hypothetical protein
VVSEDTFKLFSGVNIHSNTAVKAPFFDPLAMRESSLSLVVAMLAA